MSLEVAGQPASDRLLGQCANAHRARHAGTAPLTVGHVLTVLRALADYELLRHAVAYRRTEPNGDDPALAVGRYLHAIADQIHDGGRTDDRPTS